MVINLLAFGIAKDILGATESNFELSDSSSVADLKMHLVSQYPSFEKLSKFGIAVNQEYQLDEYILSEHDEVAIIPPVSGG